MLLVEHGGAAANMIPLVKLALLTEGILSAMKFYVCYDENSLP